MVIKRFIFAIFILIMALLGSAKAVSFRFVVISDTQGDVNGINDVILGEVVQATINENADFILISGDLVDGPYGSNPSLEIQLTYWCEIMQPLYDANIGVYPVRGNHDAGIAYSDPAKKVTWDNVFSGSYTLPANGPTGEKNVTYSFTYQNALIVGLDQYVNRQRINQTWLDDQFTSHTQPHVFVFAHEPAFKINHPDCLDDYPADRNAFWNSIARQGGRTYFCGHDGFYDHARLDDGDGRIDNDLHQFVIVTGDVNPDGAYDGYNSYWTPQRIAHDTKCGYLLVEIEGLTATLTYKHRTAPNVYSSAGDVFTYTAEPTGDFDKDGDVDFVDFAVFAQKWLTVRGVPVPQPSLWTSKIIYLANEPIVVNFTGASGNLGDWIGLYEKDAANDASIDWLYTNGTKDDELDILSGEVTFSAGINTQGQYEARLFFNNSTEPNDLKAITEFIIN